MRRLAIGKYLIVKGLGSRRWHVNNTETQRDEGGVFKTKRLAKEYALKAGKAGL